MQRMTTLPDGRPVPPATSGERTTLEGWLDFHRETLALKCSNLTDAQARTHAVPSSSLTLLGLVQHLAEVERNWFQRVFADAPDTPPVHETTGPDAFTLTEDRTLPDALAAWRTEVTRARELTATASLDATGTLSPPGSRLHRRPEGLPPLDPHPHDRGIRPPQRPRGPPARGARRDGGGVTPGPLKDA